MMVNVSVFFIFVFVFLQAVTFVVAVISDLGCSFGLLMCFELKGTVLKYF